MSEFDSRQRDLATGRESKRLSTVKGRQPFVVLRSVMVAMANNGYILRSQLAPITVAVNGQQAYLRKDAAAAFMAMNAESERRYNVTLRVATPRVAYRPYADQVYFWDLFQSGKGSPAARPGTSNHGLGIAVDLATTEMRAIVDKIGSKYGFAKAWSDAPSEWWHIKWRDGDYSEAIERERWIDYSASEKRWIQEYDRLVRAKKGKIRRSVLRRVMKSQRQRIFKAAEGERNGWRKSNRRNRYNSLKSRTS